MPGTGQRRALLALRLCVGQAGGPLPAGLAPAGVEPHGALPFGGCRPCPCADRPHVPRPEHCQGQFLTDADPVLDTRRCDGAGNGNRGDQPLRARGVPTALGGVERGASRAFDFRGPVDVAPHAAGTRQGAAHPLEHTHDFLRGAFLVPIPSRLLKGMRCPTTALRAVASPRLLGVTDGKRRGSSDRRNLSFMRGNVAKSLSFMDGIRQRHYPSWKETLQKLILHRRNHCKK